MEWKEHLMNKANPFGHNPLYAEDGIEVCHEHLTMFQACLEQNETWNSSKVLSDI
jgi:hypothetical protein